MRPELVTVKDDMSRFEELIYKDKKKVFAYIRTFISNKFVAEDILQDTLVKVFQSVSSGKYADTGKFISWVKRIAHNLIIDHFRMVKQMNTVSNDNYESDLFNSQRFADENIEDELMKKETHEDLRKILSLLPDEQKEVVILRHYKGLSFKEISLVTNVSINTALGRMRYALLNLRRLMEEYQISLS